MTKKITIKYFVLKNIGSKYPWTSTLFHSEESARKYWKETVDKNNWDFIWQNFEVIPCTITYHLPAIINKKKK